MDRKISMLRGPDRVRKRPAVIFGSENLDGAAAALNMLLDIFAQEGAKGHSDLLAVTQYPDGSLALRSNDRGIYLGAPDNADDTAWKELFCELYAGPLYQDSMMPRCIFEGPSGQEGEYADSLNLCAVQYASESMDVCVIRDGFQQTLHFEKGNPVGGIVRTPCAEPTGTQIRFKLDSEVFTDTCIPSQLITDKLQTIAIQIPGMKATFRKETESSVEEATFSYPNGIADYLLEQNRGRQASAIYCAKLTAEGQDRYNRPRYTATVATGVCFVQDAGFVKCYHNLRELTHRGTHCDSALHSIAQYLGWMLDCEISEENLLKHLQLVIVTDAERSDWVNGARTGLRSVFIRDLTQDTIGEDFRYFVKQNKEFLCDLFHQ